MSAEAVFQPRPPRVSKQDEADGKMYRASSPSSKLDASVSHRPPPSPKPLPSPRLEMVDNRASSSPKLDRWGNMLGEDAADENILYKSLKKRRKAAAVDLAREAKWLTMLENWDQMTGSEILRRRIRKGIPNSLRFRVWPMLTGANDWVVANPGVYEELLRETSDFDDEIGRDLKRTFPNHILFCSSDGESRGQKSLSNVLRAYAIYDPHVGYCQGMGFLVGIFLMFMSEEVSFWMLHSLLRGGGHAKLNLAGMYMPGFPLLAQYFYILKHFITTTCPKLAKRMRANNVTGPLYASKWFITLFAYDMPFETVLRLWDVAMHEGMKVVLQFALLLIKMNEKELLKADFQGMVTILRNVHQSELVQDPDKCLKATLDIDMPSATISYLSNRFQQHLNGGDVIELE
jgi:hypothetical protein